MATQTPTNFLAFDDVRTKLFQFTDALREAVKRVVNVDNEDLNADIDTFESNISQIIIGGTIGQSLQTLFNSFDIVGDTARNQYVLSTQLFDFGDDDTVIEAAEKQALNKKTLNTAIQIDALALGFANAVRIEYSNQEELNEVIVQLDDQYEKVITENLDSETRISLLDLKTNAFKFFSQLDLNSILTVETTTIPSTVLAYQYYKDSTRSDEIVGLNDIQNTGFIEGSTKIVSEQ